MAVQDGSRADVPALAGAGRTSTVGELELSTPWLVAAVASMAALAAVAPGGLYLIGFFGIITAAHEVGHFAVARRAGMVPTELFWGFGPVVAAVTVGRCRYGVKALFLGGYVKLEGMTPSSVLPEGFDEAGTYRAATHRGRLGTILAGPAVNLVMALVAFAAAAAIEGQAPVRALATGLGDVWFVVAATGQALLLWVSNLGGYLAAVLDGSGATAAPVRFLSPVAQAEVSGRAIALGPVVVLRWFGILSCAVGAINLLPLPPLDGSHAVVAGSEAVVQRVRRDRSIRLDVRRLLPLAWATLAVLVALSLSALVLDVRDLLAAGAGPG